MKNYEIFTPVATGDLASSFPLKHSDDRKVKYIIEPNDKEEHTIDCYYHIPFFLEPNDEPWMYGNLFVRHLLDKKSKIGEKINFKTIDKYAQSIKLFMNYCESSSINYLESESRIRSPISRYKKHLLDERSLGNLSTSTLKGRLGYIVAFYRYLVVSLKLKFNACPWGEDVKGTHLYVGYGHSSTNEYTSSSIQKVPSTNLNSMEKTFEGCLNDGGEELRPLSDDETRIVFDALKEIGNVEMLLAHLIILATGARTQTIFTLRQCHFEKKYEDQTLLNNEVILKAGNGELIDSKSGNRFTIRMPIDVYHMVQAYIKSSNAQGRYKKSKFQFPNSAHQYVFLTSHGNPYYMANDDFNKIQHKNPPMGGTLRTFISSELKPKMAELGFINPQGKFKFHNLRATFGLGVLNSYLKSLPGGLPSGLARDRAMSHVKKYMNHKQMTTTELYLDFRTNSKIGQEVGSKWNQYLISIAGL